MGLRATWSIPALVAAILAIPAAADAAGPAIRGRFSYEGTANCHQPAVRNFPIRAEGTAVLTTDRKATFDMRTNTGDQTRLKATLGGKPTEAPGGSTSLNVLGAHTLRVVREYPNNIAIVTMIIRGGSCRMTIDNRLKPGRRVYTFVSGAGEVSYCARPHITRAECSNY